MSACANTFAMSPRSTQAYIRLPQSAGLSAQPARRAQASRWTVSGENAGTHTATYSAPSASGEL